VSKVTKNCGEYRLKSLFTTMLDELLVERQRSAAANRLVQRARKRARFLREDLRPLAIANFVATNELVNQLQKSRPPSQEVDRRILDNARYFITTVLERFTTSFDELSIQRPLEMSFLWDNWRFGPGASNGILGTHTADKIHQDMTCTAQCEPLVRKLRSMNPYFVARDGRVGVSGTRQVEGSRLTTVPKNEETERTIAIEPSGNMCLQLSAGMYLEGALRHIGLDIRNQQPRNKAMAKRGSEDGSIATLDLKAASDMISIDLVRALMPSEWFDLLMKLRSPTITLPGDGKSGEVGIQLELHMISTMGNGFTFPLMTLILVALIYGYRCTRGGPNLYIDWTNTCVFGDDIIIPVHEYDGFVDVLTKAGLVVNHDKSFSSGPFRESCGGDYISGVDITPFYIKSLAVEADVYVAINQVVLWSVEHNCSLPRTLTLLRSFIDGKPHLIPEWMSPNQGVLTSGCRRRYTYLSIQQAHSRLPKEAEEFAMPLAVGGYLVPRGAELYFLPRSRTLPRFKVRRSRLPEGYLDGWDPGYRSQPASFSASHLIAIHLGS